MSTCFDATKATAASSQWPGMRSRPQSTLRSHLSRSSSHSHSLALDEADDVERTAQLVVLGERRRARHGLRGMETHARHGRVRVRMGASSPPSFSRSISTGCSDDRYARPEARTIGVRTAVDDLSLRVPDAQRALGSAALSQRAARRRAARFGVGVRGRVQTRPTRPGSPSPVLDGRRRTKQPPSSWRRTR
jgi:hypothetical protein